MPTGVIVGACVSVTVYVNVLVVVNPAWSVAVTVTVDVPAAVGVPEIVLVSLLKVTPSGKPVTVLEARYLLLSVISKTNGAISVFVPTD